MQANHNKPPITEVIHGYEMGVVEPDVIRGLQPAGATRVTLDVIIPSPTGRPDSGKVEADRDAVPAGLAFQLHCGSGTWQRTYTNLWTKKVNEPPHVFSHWEINHEKFASRVLCQLPAHYVPETRLQQNVQNVRKKPPKADIDEFKANWSFNGSPLLKSQEPCLVRPENGLPPQIW